MEPSQRCLNQLYIQYDPPIFLPLTEVPGLEPRSPMPKPDTIHMQDFCCIHLLCPVNKCSLAGSELKCKRIWEQVKFQRWAALSHSVSGIHSDVHLSTPSHGIHQLESRETLSTHSHGLHELESRETLFERLPACCWICWTAECLVSPVRRNL